MTRFPRTFSATREIFGSVFAARALAGLGYGRPLELSQARRAVICTV